MAGRAVTTTRESRVTMKKATEVRSSAQPVLVGCLGVMARVGDIGCLLCWWVLGWSPCASSDPDRARYLSPLPTARGPARWCWRACAPGRGVLRLLGSSALGGEGPGACPEAQKPRPVPAVRIAPRELAGGLGHLADLEPAAGAQDARS